LGRWRLARNASNDHGIDREAQRTQSFTGIDGIHLQDQAITESMGPIIDRSIEHLGSSDAMVIRTRRCLMRAAQALRDAGTTPPGVDTPQLYRQRSGGVILPRTADWLEATQELRQAFVEHPALVSLEWGRRGVKRWRGGGVTEWKIPSHPSTPLLPICLLRGKHAEH
jgi:hypothetical protein